ncbi:hypothetical protein RvY_02027 [Ramazzottius varieornatus]|uniref:RING-type domain-containing protein n=1 Tax=Ramazzottius varieornatus TaxID=947166 RepID=A0A1D1ULQ2_RAMVA|nr:hypothetical protein RvY_02027 [Ramazzottius varieornatus]
MLASLKPPLIPCGRRCLTVISISFVLSWIRISGAAEILVKSTQGLQGAALRAQVAQFGAPIPDGGLVGYVVRSRPPNACGPLTYEVHEDDIDFWLKPKILLVQQGPCSFSDQVDRAGQAGFRAVIIFEFGNSSEDLRLMRRDRSQNSGLNDNRTIPALFVRQRDGLLLWYSYTWSDGYYIVISSELPRREFVAWDVVLILIPIAVVVVPLSAILLMTFVAGRRPLFLTAFRQAKRRTNLINGLPERKISKSENPVNTEPTSSVIALKSDGPTVCSICLENYKPGDKVRMLPPCSHEFHSACVDPWLLSDHMVCPLCRQEVELPGDPSARKANTSTRQRIFSIPLVTFLSSPGQLLRPTHAPDLEIRTNPAVRAQAMQEHAV